MKGSEEVGRFARQVAARVECPWSSLSFLLRGLENFLDIPTCIALFSKNKII